MGAASKPTPPGSRPGALVSMNPKSMWITRPASSSMMLPLWRSLTCGDQGFAAGAVSQGL